MMGAALNAGALWLQPGGEHPAFRRYAELFGRLFRRFEVLDYRAGYLDSGPEDLERSVLSALEASTPELLIYSQFPGSYAYLSPAFLAALRERRLVVGMGFDDEIYFDQAKYFYQACSAAITTDIEAAYRLNHAGIPAHVAVTAWLAQAPPPAAAPENEDIAVSFVGDMTKPGRRNYIRHLEANGFPVADFGKGSRSSTIMDSAVSDVFRRSKINLNFTATNPPRWVLRHDPLRADARQIKGRPFELAAMGRFCLCEWAPCVEHWFRPGVDIGVFRDADDLVDQVRRYLGNDALRRGMSAAAQERFRAELAPEVQFTRVFSRILAESGRSARPLPAPALGGAIFYESMGRSRGVAFLHALRRGSPVRAMREIPMKWSWHLEYWRGFVEAVVDTIVGRLRRP